MAVPDRNISLPMLRKNVEERMLQNLEMLARAQKGKDASVHPDEKGALKQLCDVYLDSRLPLLPHVASTHMLCYRLLELTIAKSEQGALIGLCPTCVLVFQHSEQVLAAAHHASLHPLTCLYPPPPALPPSIV